MKGKKIALLTAIFSLGAFLTACGGGGGDTVTSSTDSTSTDSTVTSSSLSAYITDAPASQYPVFNATIYGIRLCNDTGCQPIFSDTTGITLDLTDLRGIMRYLGTVNIPQDVYNRIEIDVSSSVTLMDNNGNTITVNFTNFTGQNVSVSCGQDKCTITVNTTVDTTNTTSVAIDFNLDNFVVNPDTGQITQVDVRPTQPQQNNQNGQPMYEFEITGVVTSVDENNNTFDVKVAWADRDFTINVDSNTVYDDIAGLSEIQVGYCVEVEVSGDPAQATSLTALEVEVEALEECGIDDESEEGRRRLREMTGREIGDIDDERYADGGPMDREIRTAITAVNVDNSTTPPTVSITTSDGNTYTLGQNVICKIEMEGFNMNQDQQNQTEEHEEYSRGPQNCANNLNLLLQNLAQSGITSVDVELELNGTEVTKLEIEIEVDDEEEHEENEEYQENMS